MKERTRRNCERLIENRNIVKSVFPWQSRLLNLACAGVLTFGGGTADESALRDCKALLNRETGFFSAFRGAAKSPVAAMLAVSGTPEQTLEYGLEAYRMLKERFRASAYLPLTAMMIARKTEPGRYRETASRTRALYDRMKEEHPFLTSGADSAFCSLMALSAKSDDQLIGDSERCFRLLKPHFYSHGVVRSLGHVLALCGGRPEENCVKTVELFEKLKAAGHKYGSGYELPTLGVIAAGGGDLDETVREIAEIDDWLARQTGFGSFSGVGRGQRVMYAGMIAQQDSLNGQTTQVASISGTVSMIVAQQAALLAAVAASSAAAASAASSSH